MAQRTGLHSVQARFVLLNKAHTRFNSQRKSHRLCLIAQGINCAPLGN